MKDHKIDQRAKLRLIDGALAEGLADAAAGRTVGVKEAFARIRAQIGLTGAEQPLPNASRPTA